MNPGKRFDRGKAELKISMEKRCRSIGNARN